MTTIKRTLTIIAGMVVILAIGIGLRTVGLGWGETFHLHPDERFLTQVASTVRSVDSLRMYFDTMRSPLNPNNVGFGLYVYGTFPLFLVRYAGELVGQTGYFEIHMVGRALSAAFDALTIVLAYLIARRVTQDARIGLLAAGLYSVAALPIQLSHFWAVDTFATTLTMAALWFAVRLMDRINWVDVVLFGVSLGLAVASKVSIFPMGFMLVLALGILAARQLGYLGDDEPQPVTLRRLSEPVLALAAAALISVLVFRVAQPYAFLPPNSGEPIEVETLGLPLAVVSTVTEPFGFRPNPLWLDQLETVRIITSSQADSPPNHQWRSRTPVLWPLGNIVKVGLGWPLGLFACFAALWAIWEVGRGHSGAYRLLVPLAWLLLILLWQGTGWVKVMRYFLPIYPMFALFAAWGLVTLWDRISALVEAREAPRWHWSKLGAAALALIVVSGALGWGYAVSRIYTRDHTRLAASRWIVDNVPADFTLHGDSGGTPQKIQLGLPNTWPPTLPDDEQDPTRPTVEYSVLRAGERDVIAFEADFTGSLSQISFFRVRAVTQTGDPLTLFMVLSADRGGDEPLTSATLTSQFDVTSGDSRGDAYTLAFEQTVPIEEGETYYLLLENEAPQARSGTQGALLFAGATIAVEGDWDDPVPQAVDNTDVRGRLYQELKFQMAWEDTEVKRARMQYVLDNADYLTISSNRFYDSLSRNPNRWPMTIDYYQALFSGQLGYELVGDFTSRPNIGPIEFYDDEVDEAWTVYDHPRVFVFRKTADYDPVVVAEVLDQADLSSVERLNAHDASGRPVRIQRPDEYPVVGVVPAAAEPGEEDEGMIESLPILAVPMWWAVVTVLGGAAFPLMFVALPGLPDRGYAASRIVGVVLVAWVAWLLGSLVGWWGRAAVLVALVGLALVSGVLAVRHRDELFGWLRENRGLVLLVEGLFAVLFLVFVLVRISNPDLWHPFYGGEKPMDLAYFNAVLQTEQFPPYDPWFAGGRINYYYFGFVIASVPTLITGLPSEVAYNLLIPTFFALTGLGAFAVGYNLVEGTTSDGDPPHPIEEPTLREVMRAWPEVSPGQTLDAVSGDLARLGRWAACHRGVVAGVGAILLTLVLGNLDQIRTTLWAFAELGRGEDTWPVTLLPQLDETMRGVGIMLSEGRDLPVGIGEWYWNATRLIPVPLENGIPTEVQPITEFPLFTFLYADLHAHMIAFPLTLWVLLWAVALVRGARDEVIAPGVNLPWLTALFIGALGAGLLAPTNTWDAPTYVILGGGVLMLVVAHLRGGDSAQMAVFGGAVAGVLTGGGLYYVLITLSGSPSTVHIAVAGAVGVVGLITGYLVAALIASRGEGVPLRSHILTLAEAGAWGGMWLAATISVMLPYLINFRSGYSGFIPWGGSHTPLWSLLVMFGLPLAFVVTWMTIETLDWWHTNREGPLKRGAILPLIVLAAVAAGLIVLLHRMLPVAAAAVPLAVWAGVLFLQRGFPIEKRLALAMLLAAAGLIVVVEAVVLQGDIGRMNTVFKFYLQVWFLIGLPGAASLAWIWSSINHSPELIRIPWTAAVAGLVFLAALYPITATQAKVSDRWSETAPATLDGMAYMPHVERFENGVTFSLEGDYHALHWLNENVQGLPTVLEANAGLYRWGNRVSVYTGLPTVVGWDNHQRQQRAWQAGEVNQRVAEVNRAYSSPLMDDLFYVVARYDVDLVVVGELERAVYAPVGIEKFDTMVEMGYLTLVYDYQNTQIYEVEKDRIPAR